jgi:hypothetical protein
MMKPDRAHGTRNSVFVIVFNVYFSTPLGHIEPSNERDSPANSDMGVAHHHSIRLSLFVCLSQQSPLLFL